MDLDDRASHAYSARGRRVVWWKEFGGEVERAKGIEPSWPVWKTEALPLSYARNRTAD